MEITLTTYLIVCPLVFLGGFMGAIAGGGGLITLPAYLFAGIPIHYAIGTNKTSSVAGAVVAAFRYYRNGFVDKTILLPSIILALTGSIIGANVALRTSDRILEILLLFVIPITAFYVFRNKSFGQGGGIFHQRTVVLAGIISFGLGWYDGFYGPGTGTFLVLLYNSVAKLDIRMASGNGKMVNLASNAAAVVVFLVNGKVLIGLALVAAVFNMVGNYFGAGLVIKKGTSVVRPVLLIMLALIFIKVGSSYL